MISKPEAEYRTATLADFPKLCGTCGMFRLLASCTLVEGRILPWDRCKFWDFQKTGENANQERRPDPAT